MSEKVEVVEYTPKWQQDFNTLVKFLRQNLQLATAQIEHVGSTSVVGLSAKPIIDIDIIAQSTSQVAVQIIALEELGYNHIGNLGITGREAFKSPQNTTLPAHNLYVCIQDGIALRNHLLLRNLLREDAILRMQYSELKQALAKKYPSNVDHYCEAKSDFIVKLLKQGGITQEDLKVIFDENKI